jgi:hypothetical protein
LRNRLNGERLTDTGDERQRASKYLKRLVGALVSTVLLLFAAKWFLYFLYVGQNCAGRALQLNWKTSYFCVTPEQALLWKIVDTSMIVALALIGACVLFGIARRYEA